MGNIAGLVQGGRNIFGQQLSAAEALGMLQANFQGIEVMDQGRAQDFLTKVEALSSVIDVSAQGLATYLGTVNKLYQNLNMIYY